jgi:hypothetical protein
MNTLVSENQVSEFHASRCRRPAVTERKFESSTQLVLPCGAIQLAIGNVIVKAISVGNVPARSKLYFVNSSGCELSADSTWRSLPLRAFAATFELARAEVAQVRLGGRPGFVLQPN